MSLSLTIFARLPSALAFLNSGYSVFRMLSISSGYLSDIPMLVPLSFRACVLTYSRSW